MLEVDGSRRSHPRFRMTLKSECQTGGELHFYDDDFGQCMSNLLKGHVMANKFWSVSQMCW